MFTENDIKIESYTVDEFNFYLVDFRFSCDCNLLGIDIADGETARIYMILNLITDDIKVTYMLSQEDYDRVHELNISDEDKKVLRSCAENFIKDETGMTITQYLKGPAAQQKDGE